MAEAMDLQPPPRPGTRAHADPLGPAIQQFHDRIDETRDEDIPF
jgi:hypothetical protein